MRKQTPKCDWPVFDIETDGLNATKIHCLAVNDGEEVFGTYDYDEMRVFLEDAEYLVCHNAIRFDIPTLERILGIKIKAKLVDTLALSWILEPYRNRHGLEYHGEDRGIAKPKVEDWLNLSPEEYMHRCKEDTKINRSLWDDYWKYLCRIYDNDVEKIKQYLDYIEFKMTCARKQEESQWALDVKLVKTSLEKMLIEQADRVEELKSVMPPVPIIDEKKRPAKMYKADGTLSAHGKKWVAFLDERGLDRKRTEPVEYIKGYNEPNPNSTDQVKKWLFDLGWKCQTFKIKKDEKTGKFREIPQLQQEHGKGIDPGIEQMFDDHPELKVLDGLGVLQHRISILNGYLANVSDDGFVKAEIQGLTNTLRFKHAVVVNLPKVNKPYGDVVRGALVAREGKLLCGSDMSGLEDRLKQHFIYKFDPDFVAMVNRDDYDPHLTLGVMGNMLSKEDMDEYVRAVANKEKPNPAIKAIRDIAKNGNYSCQYGAGPPRIAITAGISLQQAKVVHKAYWDLNWGIKAVADDQKVIEVRDLRGQMQMWLVNPINGFCYSLRFTKDIFSTLIQGTASYCFDCWVGFVLQEYDQTTAQFHDENVWEIDNTEEAREKMTDIIRRAIKQTNEYLVLDRELDVDIQYGIRYSEIH